eukprot:2013701-Amphidinium_carterae.2
MPWQEHMSTASVHLGVFTMYLAHPVNDSCKSSGVLPFFRHGCQFLQPPSVVVWRCCSVS